MVICHMANSLSYYYNLWKVLRIESTLTRGLILSSMWFPTTGTRETPGCLTLLLKSLHIGLIFSAQTISFAYALYRSNISDAKRSCCVMKVKCATMALVFMSNAEERIAGQQSSRK